MTTFAVTAAFAVTATKSAFCGIFLTFPRALATACGKTTQWRVVNGMAFSSVRSLQDVKFM